MQVAIDGPAGSGKSTVSKTLAEKYALVYIDTGAMYRAAALVSLLEGAFGDRLVETLKRTAFEFVQKADGQHLFVSTGSGAEDVSDAIRTPEVTNLVADVAAIPEVRSILTEKQRQIAAENDVIMDGRDIGTVVLPDADLKVFLVASAEERARRRFIEWETKHEEVSYEDILADMKKRDEQDASRATAPLKKATDAREIDTTRLTLEEVVTIIGAEIERVQGN